MKTITPAMKAHIESDVTTLATCWNIIRQDGVKFFYTEHDEDILYKGETYLSTGGFSKSAIKTTATLAADNMEVSGFFEDAGITDEEMRNGAFDFAKVEVFAVNFMDLTDTMGIIRLRSGFFGEVRTSMSGAFLVELRGLIDMLGQKIGRVYLPECDVDFGSTKCGIEIFAPIWEAGQDYSTGDRVIYPIDSPDDFVARHYPNTVDPDKGAPDSAWPFSRGAADVNCTPVHGDTLLQVQGGNDGLGSSATLIIPKAQLDISPTELSAQLYKLTFSGSYFEYFRESKAVITIECRASGGALILNQTQFTAPAKERPGRKWRPFSVSVNLHQDMTHIAVSIATATIFDKHTRPKTCFDNLDLYISPRDIVVPDYAVYANREFIAQNDGRAGTTPPTWDTTIGDDTVDGGVTWTAARPKYAFLCRVDEDAIKSQQFTMDLSAIGSGVGLHDDYFLWGVVKFLTGPNAGRSMEVMDINYTTGVVKLALPLPYQSLENNKFILIAGCDKRQATCKLWGNILNFRGFPNLPGEGQYFKVAGM
jgi:hypothetical protein